MEYKDFMSVAEGLTATKAGLEVAKLIMDKLNWPTVDVHEVRSNVQEMLIHVVNAQVALAEAQIEIADLRRQLNDRDSFRSLSEDMEFQIDGGFYVRKSEESRGVIRYCPVCWKKDGKTIHLEPSGIPGWYRCPVDKSVYKTVVRGDDEMNGSSTLRKSSRSDLDGWKG